MTNIENYGIHWFRRDLRIFNPALQRNIALVGGKVLGIFCFDQNFLSREDFSFDRFQFFLETLKILKQDMKERGGDLLVVNQAPFLFFDSLIQYLKNHSLTFPKVISFNRDYEPFARDRDSRVVSFFKRLTIDVLTERDHLFFEPEEISKEKSNDGYQVFTPFSFQWMNQFRSSQGQQRLVAARQELLNLKNPPETLFRITWQDLTKYTFQDSLDHILTQNLKNTSVPIPKPGPKEAYKKLQHFSSLISEYEKNRDFPCKNSSSGLSIYLKNGTITVGQIISELHLNPFEKSQKPSSSQRFLLELIWREFFYHILFRFPFVEHTAFQEKYRNIKWIENESFFQRWKMGLTGFPIVDAGMRQLNETGFMHNRVRMIVAAFLTKDLHINWQKGEKYFMQRLLDGDLSANNGGWQWAASTGCDAAPYFRIFNPWNQSSKFDPKGEYMKTYLPELRSLKPETLHKPILRHPSYPSPMVDHKIQREKALKIYTNLQ